MNIMYIALIAVAAVLLALQFKEVKQEYGLYISLAVCVIIFMYSISKFSLIIDGINELSSYIDIHNSYIVTLVRIIGVTYVAQFTADICKDAGYSAISNQVQIFGKITVLAISMPILLALIDTINKLMS